MTKLASVCIAVLPLLAIACGEDSSGTNGSGGAAGSGVGGVGAGGGASGGASGAGATSSGGASSGGTGAGGGSGAVPTVGGCGVFTAGDDWNKDISGEPVDAAWTTKVQNLVGSKNLHPDYGNSGTEQYGIPINTVPQGQAAVPIIFDDWPDESDPGPYPFPGPGTVKIEGGTATNCSGDCHVIVVQQGTCMLYEGFACHHESDGWHCANGAKWDLTKASYGQRPKGWTSADAAGLAIMPGLIRYDEAKAGAINHAIRFTLHCSTNKFVAPATHQAVPKSCQGMADTPPMGLRVRLKADFDISGFSGAPKAVLTAMKKYGMILADNGSDFFFQGESHPGWSDADVEPLKQVPVSAFEVVTPPPLEP